MIWTIFLALLLFSSMLIGYGYFTDSLLVELVGITFLFTLSILLVNGVVEYKSGHNETVSFTYLNESTNTINQTLSSVVDVYTPFNDTTSKFIGTYLALLSILLFTLAFIEYRSEEKFISEND